MAKEAKVAAAAVAKEAKKAAAAAAKEAKVAAAAVAKEAKEAKEAKVAAAKEAKKVAAATAPIDSDEVDEVEVDVEVDEVEWAGRTYLVDDDGTLYDDSHATVGRWTDHATVGSEPVWNIAV